MAQNSSTNPATGGGTTIPGTTAADQLSGGGGNDTIIGDSGDDRLSGDAPLPGQWQYSVYDRNFSSANGQTSLIGDTQSTLIGHGYVDDFNVLALRNTLSGASAGQNRDDFGIIYRSGLSITAPGVYTFSTTSDDGSRIIIRNANGVEVFNLNNDFHQSARTETASVNLPAGQYTIEVRYWENAGDTAMSGTIAGPGLGATAVDLATSPLITTPPPAPGHIDGDDSILGDAGNDTITGGGGNDRLFGGADVDSILGEAGNDSIDGGIGSDRLFGGLDDDSILGGDGSDTIDGGNGSDRLFGGADDDSISGGDGNDSLDGGNGADALIGGIGSDSLFGGDGADSLDGQNDGDFLSGGAGNDLLSGGAGNDTISGEGGTDRIDGGGDADSIDGGADNDTIQGGSGNDTVFSDSVGSGTDSIDGGTGDDSLMFGDGDDTVFGGNGSDTIDDRNGINLPGTNLLYGGDGNDVTWAGFGNDSVYGDAGNDLLQGEQDNDTIFGGTGMDTMSGGTGNDLFDYAAGDVETVGGTPGTGPVESIFGGGTGSGPSDSLTDFDVVDLTDIVGQYGWKRVIIAPLGPENGLIEILDAPGGNVIATIYYDNIEDIIRCFTPGTMILTDRGEVAVEALEPGDLVVTRDHGLQPLRWVGRQHVSRARLMAEPELQPVRIAQGALAGDGPSQSLLVSPQHRVLVAAARAELLFGEAEVLVPARHLIGHAEVTRAVPEAGVTYIHILFDRHEIVRSDGIWTESFQPAERVLDAMEGAVRAEILAIFPDLSRDTSAYAGSRLSLKAHEAKVLFAL